MAKTTIPRFRLPEETDKYAWIAIDPSASPTAACKVGLRLNTETGALDVDFVQQAQSGSSMREVEGLDVSFQLPYPADAVRLTADINAGKFDSLFARFCAEGEDEDWEVRNGLEEALLEYELYEPQAGVYDAGFWLGGIDPAEEYGITADTDDEELEEIAEQIEQEAYQDGCVVAGLLEHLQWLRDDLADAAR